MLAPATYWKRIAAFSIDLTLFAIYLLILGALSLAGLKDSLEQVFPTLYLNPLTFDIFAFITTILPLLTYFSFLEQSSWQGTVGKRIMKIRVVSLTGSRIGCANALLRSGLKFLPWQLAHTAVFHIILRPETQNFFLYISVLAQALVLANILTAILGRKHQSIYDRISGTRVVVAEG